MRFFAKRKFNRNWSIRCVRWRNIAGSMTDPPALARAANIADTDAATVYPLTTLLRSLAAQVFLIVMLR